MSSDDDSDFLSSSDALSDDDQTMKIPSGGSGARPAKATAAASPPKSIPTTSTATTKRLPQGNLLTDLFQYIIFQDDIGDPESSSQGLEEETTPLSYRKLNALEQGPTEASPEDYGSLTPPASFDTTFKDQTGAGSDSATLCHSQCHQDEHFTDYDEEGRAKCREQSAPVFRMLFMLIVLLVCLFLILSVCQAAQCQDMYGYEVSHWWCF